MTMTRTAHMRETTMFFYNKLAIICLACSSTSSKVFSSMSKTIYWPICRLHKNNVCAVFWLYIRWPTLCAFSLSLALFLHFFCLTQLGKGRIESPHETVNFLDNWKRILESSRFTAASVEECMDSAGSVCNNDTVALVSQFTSPGKYKKYP